MSRRVAYKRVVEVDRLGVEERARLERELVQIPLKAFANVDEKTVSENAVFRGDGTWLLLLYDRDDELLGFCSSRVSMHEVAGRTWGVLDTGVFLEPGVSGGGAAVARSALAHGLRFKRRHPLTPLCCISPATNPAIYRMTMRSMTQVHPRPGAAAPPEVEALVQAVIEDRGLVPVPGKGDWLVRLPITARIRDPQRMLRSRTLEDPASRFFLERCPRWSQGECLMVYFAFDLRHMIASAVRSALQGLRPERPRA